MKLGGDVILNGVDQAVADLGRQTGFIASLAINRTANAVRDALRDEVNRVFDRPTPYIQRAWRVTQYSSKDRLEALIEPAYMGGKGVPPGKVLKAEVFGGERRQKRSERALQRVGILPQGYYTVPGAGAPLDAYGNVPGSFIVRLISYFQAFPEQGYRANMTAKRRAKLADRQRTAGGYVAIRGVEYFVAWGGLRGGKSAHLKAGIYSRTGIHGSDVKPVLLFVRQASYRPLLQMRPVAQRVVDAQFNAHLGQAMLSALRTARRTGGGR